MANAKTNMNKLMENKRKFVVERNNKIFKVINVCEHIAEINIKRNDEIHNNKQIWNISSSEGITLALEQILRLRYLTRSCANVGGLDNNKLDTMLNTYENYLEHYNE